MIAHYPGSGGTDSRALHTIVWHRQAAALGAWWRGAHNGTIIVLGRVISRAALTDNNSLLLEKGTKTQIARCQKYTLWELEGSNPELKRGPTHRKRACCCSVDICITQYKVVIRSKGHLLLQYWSKVIYRNVFWEIWSINLVDWIRFHLRGLYCCSILQYSQYCSKATPTSKLVHKALFSVHD